MKSVRKPSASSINRVKDKTLPLLRGMFICPDFLDNLDYEPTDPVYFDILMEVHSQNDSFRKQEQIIV